MHKAHRACMTNDEANIVEPAPPNGLSCGQIFLLGFMLCKSALFIENYIKQLYRLRRCLLFT